MSSFLWHDLMQDHWSFQYRRSEASGPSATRDLYLLYPKRFAPTLLAESVPIFTSNRPVQLRSKDPSLSRNSYGLTASSLGCHVSDSVSESPSDDVPAMAEVADPSMEKSDSSPEFLIPALSGSERVADLSGYLGQISPEMGRFAQRQYRNATSFAGKNRRLSRRVPVLVPVLCVPVDQDGEVDGEPFDTLSRDITEEAIGLIHSETFQRSRLALQFEVGGELRCILSSRIWQDVLGPYYGSAMRFERELPTFQLQTSVSRPDA